MPTKTAYLHNAPRTLDARPDRFVWQQSGELELWLRTELEEAKRGHDHPEGIALWNAGEVLVVCDAPSERRFDKPATLIVDEIKLPS